MVLQNCQISTERGTLKNSKQPISSSLSLLYWSIFLSSSYFPQMMTKKSTQSKTSFLCICIHIHIHIPFTYTYAYHTHTHTYLHTYPPLRPEASKSSHADKIPMSSFLNKALFEHSHMPFICVLHRTAVTSMLRKHL